MTVLQYDRDKRWSEAHIYLHKKKGKIEMSSFYIMSKIRKMEELFSQIILPVLHFIFSVFRSRI